ncbi:RloB family protein [Micromonospora sp. NPDC020750]|uniref:RloB family protein n=1 Tax=unclassified Micromonospora TaxID=2617518 RepID=UPI00379BAEA2
MTVRRRGRESYERLPRGTARRRDVWVFTEGELTEPQYVDLVKDLQPVRRNEVHIANDTRRPGGQRGRGTGGSGRKPKDLVEDAIDLLDRLREQVRGLPDELMPVVWCIFDRDQHEDVDQAIARATRAGVRVAFSHPCFELWRLLHHQPYTARASGNCEEVARRLPGVASLTAQERKAVTFGQIQGGFADARKRAVQLERQYASHVPFSQRDPYTDVWKFVEDLGVTEY